METKKRDRDDSEDCSDDPQKRAAPLEKPTLLAVRNAHPRDARIEFFEGPHIYVIDKNDSVLYTSVTTFNGSHFKKYNVEESAEKKMKKREYRNDPRYEFYKKSKDEIVEMLNQTGNAASAAGTAMHYALECHWNEMEIPAPAEFRKELDMFRHFVKDKTTELTPYRTEWEIFDEDLLLAGSIDMVFERPDGQLLIYDWKRCRNLDNTTSRDTALTECIKHMPDTKLAHYTLQLNTYKTILEKHYGKKVAGMVLVGLHPEQNTYLHIEVPSIPDDIEALFKMRAEEIQGDTSSM